MLRGLKHLLCMIQSDIHVFLSANELINPGYLFFNAFWVFMQRFCVHIYFHLEMRNLRRSSTVKFGYLSGKFWENVNIFLYTHRRENFLPMYSPYLVDTFKYLGCYHLSVDAFRPRWGFKVALSVERIHQCSKKSGTQIGQLNSS